MSIRYPRTMSPSTPRKIDDYARSMFRFEYLHDEWINRCTDYVRSIFGARIRGATVVDYAFGRGNWSVAFARAGAAVVYAIDASPSNAAKFQDYCREQRLQNIQIICGNILDRRIKLEADIIWVYGILPMIQQSDVFVSGIVELARDNSSLFLFYTYNSGSLREFVVESTRTVLHCRTEAEFRRLSFQLAPAARLRARDDLTAPYIHWHSVGELLALLKRHGLHPIREVNGFDKISSFTRPRPEFAPIHIICRKGAAKNRVRYDRVESSRDIQVLRQVTQSLLENHKIKLHERRGIAIGLLNTHFSTLYYSGSASEVIVQDFLFLLYALLIAGVKTNDLPRASARICRLALARLNRNSIAMKSVALNDSIIETFLTRKNFRL